eukprot:1140562-Pelagomonas_calceolata.AAC.4
MLGGPGLLVHTHAYIHAHIHTHTCAVHSTAHHNLASTQIASMRTYTLMSVREDVLDVRALEAMRKEHTMGVVSAVRALGA